MSKLTVNKKKVHLESSCIHLLSKFHPNSEFELLWKNDAKKSFIFLMLGSIVVKITVDAKWDPLFFDRILSNDLTLRKALSGHVLVPSVQFPPKQVPMDHHVYDILYCDFIKCVNLERLLFAEYSMNIGTIFDQKSYEIRKWKGFARMIQILILLKQHSYAEIDISLDQFVVAADPAKESLENIMKRMETVIKLDHESIIEWSDIIASTVHKPAKREFKAPELNRKKDGAVVPFDLEKALVFSIGMMGIYWFTAMLYSFDHRLWFRWVNDTATVIKGWTPEQMKPAEYCIFYRCIHQNPENRCSFNQLYAMVQHRIYELTAVNNAQYYRMNLGHLSPYVHGHNKHQQNKNKHAPKNHISVVHYCVNLNHQNYAKNEKK
jgi:hypothetical protein